MNGFHDLLYIFVEDLHSRIQNTVVTGKNSRSSVAVHNFGQVLTTQLVKSESNSVVHRCIDDVQTPELAVLVQTH